MIDIVFDHPEGMRRGEFMVMKPTVSDDGKDVTYEPVKAKDMVLRTVYFPLSRPSLVEQYEMKRSELLNGELECMLEEGKEKETKRRKIQTDLQTSGREGKSD